MADDKNTILKQTGQEVQDALDKIIALGLATAEKDGLLSAEDKVKLNNLYVDTALIGRATAPTPAENENSTQIATTAYVQTIKRKMLADLVVIADELPTATEQTMGHIYAVPSDDPEAQNTRIEYITVRSGNPGSYTYSWEKFGAVDVPPQEQADWDESDTDSPSYIQNKPTIPAAQVQADWSEADTTKKSFIQNKPSIPAAQVNADWNAGSGVAQILNKPTIPTQLSQLSADSTHRVVTDMEKATWDAKYTKPSSGIPASDIASGVIPTVPALSTDIESDMNSDTKTTTPRAVYRELTAIRTAMAALDALVFEPVATLPTASASTMNAHIYLVPNPSDNTYRDMYITIQDNGVYQWSQIGTTQFNISGIANIPYTGAALEQNVTIND